MCKYLFQYHKPIIKIILFNKKNDYKISNFTFIEIQE